MLKQIKNGLLFGLIAGLSMLIIGISYAAFTTLPTEGPGDDLTFGKWNAVINRLNSIDKEQLATAWVQFDGINCPGNVCVINGGYNVSSVTKLSMGNYQVNFLSTMDNTGYSAVAAMSVSGSSSEHPYVGYYTVNSINVALAHTVYIDQSNISVQVFGGKN